ncbi:MULTISPECIES: cysteine hydrolase family protein [unclassified Curtobacterium]|uniref:cysteine hydrolase family protein n=1 Tax=unclassified Curtobacterium TaxID=257496 RepID=UPI0009F6E645|nr:MULTISPECIES: isochorismatase family protein [unclassified Curtobacterium]WIA95400.1 isochorismatase family protein [Curtobacterium sp. MCBA15_004]WIA98766.1 isochorismatase family protein [Curtobacterium sp. MCBA15_012]
MSVAVPDDAWLVAIDLQRIFTGDSPWAAPRYDDAAAGTERLLPRFAGRTVVTRFVAPSRPAGAWVPYYRDWSFALVPDTDPLYALTEPFAAAAAAAVAAAASAAASSPGSSAGRLPVVTEPTFGKWGSALRAVVGEHPHLVLTGVSTDCCVLSTALAAADAGATVTVVADACAGATDADHERALDAMRLYAPLITVVERGTDLVTGSE